LKPDGVLSLIVPDKRYCFDAVSPVTTTGEILDAAEQRRRQPSPGKVFDHFANAVRCDGAIAWSPQKQGSLEYVHDWQTAVDYWQRARTGTDYIDVHSWRFTPDSFRLVLNDLRSLGLTELTILAEFDTEGCEFYVTLGKLAELPDDRKAIERSLAAVQ
jgi:hypothetical protein